MRFLLSFFIILLIGLVAYKITYPSSSTNNSTEKIESIKEIDTFISQIEEEENDYMRSFDNVDFYSQNVIKFDKLQKVEPEKVHIVDLVGDEELNYFLDNSPIYHNLEIFQLVNADVTTTKFEALIIALKDKKHLKKLSLFHCNIKDVPNSIEVLTNLEVLDLSMNNLSKMPENITKLKNLRWIRFYNNRQLSSLHENLGNLLKLEHLDVAGTRLTTFPSSIGNCKRLRHITANACKIRFIPPSIGKCTSLEYINLGANRIDEIPDEMGNLTNLKNLSMGNNISKIPESFKNLTQMESFDFSRNKLTEFPRSILTYHNMYTLWLHENDFSDLPKEVGLLKGLGGNNLLIDLGELNPKDIENVKKFNPKIRLIEQD